MSGVLSGVRLRKNFKTREEATAEKTVLEIKALHSASGLRSIVTALTEDRVREAAERAEDKSACRRKNSRRKAVSPRDACGPAEAFYLA